LRLISIDGNELQGNESDKLVHWCHGAPGVLHMLLLAFKVQYNRGSGTPFILCGSGSGLFEVSVLFLKKLKRLRRGVLTFEKLFRIIFCIN
jgi:hypothetical protein